MFRGQHAVSQGNPHLSSPPIRSSRSISASLTSTTGAATGDLSWSDMVAGSRGILSLSRIRMTGRVLLKMMLMLTRERDVVATKMRDISEADEIIGAPRMANYSSLQSASFATFSLLSLFLLAVLLAA